MHLDDHCWRSHILTAAPISIHKMDSITRMQERVTPCVLKHCRFTRGVHSGRHFNVASTASFVFHAAPQKKINTSANIIYIETMAGPLFRTSLYRLMKKSYGMSAFPVKPLRYTRAVLGYLWKGATAEAKRRETQAAVPPDDETHSPQCRPLSKVLRRKTPTLQRVQPENLSVSLQDGFM